MKRSAVSVGLFALVSAMAALAAQSQYQPATIVSIEQKSTTRVLYYMVDTPITQEDPYYEIGLRLNDTIYTSRYNPRHKHDVVPEEWKEGAIVQVRLLSHHLYAKTPAGRELELLVTKKRASFGEVNPQPVPPSK